MKRLSLRSAPMSVAVSMSKRRTGAALADLFPNHHPVWPSSTHNRERRVCFRGRRSSYSSQPSREYLGWLGNCKNVADCAESTRLKFVSVWLASVQKSTPKTWTRIWIDRSIFATVHRTLAGNLCREFRSPEQKYGKSFVTLICLRHNSTRFSSGFLCNGIRKLEILRREAREACA